MSEIRTIPSVHMPITQVAVTCDSLLSDSDKELLQRIGPGDSFCVQRYDADGKLEAQVTGDGVLIVRIDVKSSGDKTAEHVQSRGTPQRRERELEVVYRLLYLDGGYNQVLGTDFFAPYVPSDQQTRKKLRDTPVDVEVVSETDRHKKLQLQVTSSQPDYQFRSQLARDKKAFREDTVGATIAGMKKAISKKRRRHGEQVCKDLVLVIDAWPTLTEDDVREFLSQERDFIDSAPFRGLWVVSPEVDYVIRLK